MLPKLVSYIGWCLIFAASSIPGVLTGSLYEIGVYTSGSVYAPSRMGASIILNGSKSASEIRLKETGSWADRGEWFFSYGSVASVLGIGDLHGVTVIAEDRDRWLIESVRVVDMSRGTYWRFDCLDPINITCLLSTNSDEAKSIVFISVTETGHQPTSGNPCLSQPISDERTNNRISTWYVFVTNNRNLNGVRYTVASLDDCVLIALMNGSPGFGFKKGNYGESKCEVTRKPKTAPKIEEKTGWKLYLPGHVCV